MKIILRFIYFIILSTKNVIIRIHNYRAHFFNFNRFQLSKYPGVHIFQVSKGPYIFSLKLYIHVNPSMSVKKKICGYVVSSHFSSMLKGKPTSKFVKDSEFAVGYPIK